ncbi:fructose-bisphosphatase class III, partial [Citrobacter sp. AAK_AS5]
YLDKWSRIHFDRGFAYLNETFYPLQDTYFPTVNKKEPSALNDDEVDLMETLANEFMHSAKLKAHVEFLISHGSMYLTDNGNLLFHG